jgi:hypothetical protein
MCRSDCIRERIHDACKICGADADVTFINQETGLCNACESGVFI